MVSRRCGGPRRCGLLRRCGGLLRRCGGLQGGVVVFKEVWWSIRRCGGLLRMCGGLVVIVLASRSPVPGSILGPWPPHSVV